jgi:TP53 regulating kinase-like protein
MEGLTLIAKGAEADLLLDEDWNGVKALVKKRGKKKYRHPQLDAEIRRSRTIREASVIHRAKEAGVPTPLIFQVDVDGAAIVMEYVDGRKVRDIVSELDEGERVALFRTIGESAGRLHGAGIIHGDLTTSNLIESSGRVVFIDFGLAEVSTETEKRGVDLNLMYRMLTSTHFAHAQELFSAFREGYLTTMGDEGEEALSRMEEVSRRGRYVERE